MTEHFLKINPAKSIEKYYYNLTENTCLVPLPFFTCPYNVRGKGIAYAISFRIGDYSTP